MEWGENPIPGPFKNSASKYPTLKYIQINIEISSNFFPKSNKNVNRFLWSAILG